MKKKKTFHEQHDSDCTLYFCITSLVNPYLKKTDPLLNDLVQKHTLSGYPLNLELAVGLDEPL